MLNVSEMVQDRHTYTGILIVTYARLLKAGCH